MAQVNDASLTDPLLDKVSRAPFSRRLSRLVRTAQENPNVVIGLNGPWGGGKTTAINFAVAYLIAAEKSKISILQQNDVIETEALEKQLRLPVDTRFSAAEYEQHRKRRLQELEEGHGANKGETIIVRYNPWLVSGHDTLISDFFRLLGDSVAKFAVTDSTKDKIRKSAIEVAHFVEGASGTASAYFDYTALAAVVTEPSGATSAGSKLISWLLKKLQKLAGRFIERQTKHQIPKTLEEARQRLIGALNEAKRRVLVIIDDIDRLQPDEVKSMLSMVKSVGDLPHVTYLLGFDRRLVEEALGVEDINDLERPTFLEKIIQFQVELPRARGKDIERQLVAWLPTLLGRDLTISETDDLEMDFIYGREMLETPRDLSRLQNALLWIRIATDREIRVTDVIRFELIRLKEPRLFEWLMRNQGRLSGRYDTIAAWSDGESRINFFKSAFEAASATRREACRHWLTRTLREFESDGIASLSTGVKTQDPMLGWPLSSVEGWHSYTALYPHADTIPQEWWQAINDMQGLEDKCSELILSLNQQNRTDGIPMLHSLVEDIPRFISGDNPPIGLFTALMKAPEDLWWHKYYGWGGRTEMALTHLIKLIPEFHRNRILMQLVADTDVSLGAAALVTLILGRPYRYIWSYTEGDKPNELASLETVQALAAELAKRIEVSDRASIGWSNRIAPVLELFAKQKSEDMAFELGAEILDNDDIGGVGLLIGVASYSISNEGFEFAKLRKPSIYPYEAMTKYAARVLKARSFPEYDQLFKSAIKNIPPQ